MLLEQGKPSAICRLSHFTSYNGAALILAPPTMAQERQEKAQGIQSHDQIRPGMHHLHSVHYHMATTAAIVQQCI